MAISLLTRNEFLLFAQINKIDLFKSIVNKKPDEILVLRWNCQVALSHFAKGKSKIDQVQLDILERLSWLEKWARKKFDRELKKNDRTKVYSDKTTLNFAWEKFLKRFSY